MFTSHLSNFFRRLKPSHKILAAGLLAGLGGMIGIAFAGGKPGPAVVQLSGVDYLHRWAQDNQHEFTPRGQENLDHWTDMVTINYYPNVKDGEALAKTASNVVEAYRSHRGMILKTSSVPRTADKLAEHFVAVVLPTPELLESASARFVIIDGVGVSIVFSHREYGADVGNQMSAWLKKNGDSMENALKSLNKIPSPSELKQP